MRPLAFFGALALSLATAAAAKPDWDLTISQSAPSGIAFVGEPATSKFTVTKNSAGAADVTLSLTLREPNGEAGAAQEWPLAFTGPGTKEQTLTLDTSRRGYWVLTARLLRDGKEILTRQSAFAVVDKLPNYNRMDPHSFFGTMFIRDPEAAQRIGVKTERAQAVWEWLSPKQGEYDWEKLDARIASLEQHGVATVLVIRPEIPPKWAPWKTVEEMVEGGHLPLFAKFAEDLTARYKDRVLAIEVVNEPDLEVARGASGRVPTSELYAKILKVGFDAIRKVAPELPVIGLDVSGVDFPHLRFSREVLAIDRGSMNIIGGHPYAGSRYLGADSRAESPDAIQTRSRFASMADLMRQYEIPPRIWSTEFGWGLHKDEPLHSPATELLAAYVAQAITLTRSVPEVEKLFWFSMFFPGYEGGYTYGLFHGIPPHAYPTPGAAVYATCARFLADVDYIREIPLPHSAKALRFADKTSSDAVFVLWLSEPKSVGGEMTLTIADDTSSSLLAEDGYGRTLGRDWTIRAMPVFVRVPAADADRLEQALRSARVEAREALLIERVYLTEAGSVRIDIANNSGAPMPVKIFPAGESSSARSRSLPPGPSTVNLPLVAPLHGQGEVALELLEETTSKRRAFSLRHDLTPIPQVRDIALDGDERKLAALTSVTLNQREDVMPRDPGVDWNGAKDLSMRTWFAWTTKGLYLAVKVTDDTATTSPAGNPQFWRNDSLQIGWDMGNRADTGYNADSHEIGVYQTPDGAAVNETHPTPGLREDIPVKIRRDTGSTLYELLIPWTALGTDDAAPGRVFRMNVIANDNDGRERKCWIGLSPGIGESKRPEAFRQWVLQPAATHQSPTNQP